jgi:choline dehydrogenase-like flavoprotein
MDIVDLASLTMDGIADVDLVIVGAGPVGLTLARELAGTSARIVILESGLLELDANYFELNRVDCEPSPQFDPLDPFRRAYHSNNCPVWDPELERYGMRLRSFGGSSAYWGGKVATFEPVDFAERSWVPDSGWPISYETLSPYFDRAGEVLNLGPNIYDARLWPLLGKKEFLPAIDPGKLKTTFWQFARSRVDKLDMVRFGKEYRALDAPNVRVLLNATVTRIDLSSDCKRFKGLEVSTLDGRRYVLRAGACVLAAGAIENARLLLASNHQVPNGIGNALDTVGRYLMDHPGAKLGTFSLGDLPAIVRRFGFFGLRKDQRTHMYMHGLSLSPEIQAAEELPHAALFMLEGIAPDDPFKALVRLGRMQSKNVGGDLVAVATSVGLLAKGIGMKIFQSNIIPEYLKDRIINVAMGINPNFVVREYQSINMPHKLECLEIHAISEQFPDRDSRVRLAETRDIFGVPRAVVEWRPGDKAVLAIARLAQVMRDEFRRVGLPAPDLADWISLHKLEDGKVIDMAHTLGTTRMSSDPARGVVDTNCQVHGVGELYIGGGSVLPTSGHANPTLMILSLAIRLADHLKQQLPKTGNAEVRD